MICIKPAVDDAADKGGQNPYVVARPETTVFVSQVLEGGF
jgi:hypothetical protein